MQFRLITYNIHKGIGGVDRRYRLERIIETLARYKADIILLPVSGTYVMTAEEAVAAARDIGPEVAIPMHYGDIVGTSADAERFSELYSGKSVIK